ncbi:MAG: hypothetical protein A2504_15980 [Bdellovibrionales bacterium RIFOXYD12_FULL_39_22]|nr:MAG: hypothetical protein A2385_07890 [Bdellovibrionales bacterium RIFOXYB1_FULL_39_21]OFZ43020.1 MAG: hypothetical protein A2485_11335 [Bdellovibrionales bacterium RIFOXYC12_FULL_39_17]OFZ50894.1 MAG: hypothetical protein A2404_06805 [Bdellovibrionales bacterium RIFOXYC1_FULL_39_130]OFZ73631.1 MAG: hypothetical protein A2451_06335 [Bdellovibrionales bacterium RIFOXYC2_FULL_39_8]OFZ78117.1 MAG: hypothetical protein A2560_01975 [Bdellovibrionales bacterium RIFOXYD1_FULL_39_84]OFZ93985.1 MAG:
MNEIDWTTPSELLARNCLDYQLIDSGNERKLERISQIIVERPSPQSIWPIRKAKSEWSLATSISIRKKDGGGIWKHLREVPANLSVGWPSAGEKKELRFSIQLTTFGHCGVFFEQEAIWSLLQTLVSTLQASGTKNPKILNLFGYTGCASIVMANLGAEVTHVDSAKGVLSWGEENQKLNSIPEHKINWQHDDVMNFIRSAARKKIQFDGILADPPSWGHGIKKEKWIFEEHIFELLKLSSTILRPEKSFFLLTTHTPGVQHQALRNVLKSNFWKFNITSGDIGLIHSNDERILPAGVYGLARSNNRQLEK